MNSTIFNLLHLAEVFRRHSTLKESSISRYAAGSGDLLARLRNGKDITTGRAERITQWFSDRWPDDAEWPADIPRPQQAHKHAA